MIPKVVVNHCKYCTGEVDPLTGANIPVNLCHLHAATADLLAACKDALATIRWAILTRPSDRKKWRNCETQLTAAIKKAEGDSAE